jgi:hypothetical protein
MAPPGPFQLPLTLLLFYGALSRFSHGAYVDSDFYAFQTARQADDGSIAAIAVPCMDLILAIMMLMGPRAYKSRVALFSGLANGMSLAKLVLVDGWGLDQVWGDLVVTAFCGLAWLGR